MITDRRKDKNRSIREIIDYLNGVLEKDFKRTCKCGKIVLMPKDHHSCIDCTPVSEGGNKK